MWKLLNSLSELLNYLLFFLPPTTCCLSSNNAAIIPTPTIAVATKKVDFTPLTKAVADADMISAVWPEAIPLVKATNKLPIIGTPIVCPKVRDSASNPETTPIMNY